MELKKMLVSAALVFGFSATATTFLPGFYFSPGASIGYTFGAGINYGLELDLGLYRFTDKVSSVNAGISLSSYWVQTKKYTHRLSTLNAMIEGKNFDVKFGWGKAFNKWGYKYHNQCKVGGFNYDLSVTSNQLYAPWIGMKRFKYSYANWAWFSKPYNSVYVKYKYDVLGNSGFKTGEDFLLK